MGWEMTGTKCAILLCFSSFRQQRSPSAHFFVGDFTRGSASHPEAALAIIGDLRRKMYQFLKFRQHKTAFSGIGRAATRPPPPTLEFESCLVHSRRQ